MIQIFDDVVSKQYQDVIEDAVFSPDFSWHYNPTLTSQDKESHNYGFFHTLIRLNHPSQRTDVTWLNLFSPLVYESASKANININQIVYMATASDDYTIKIWYKKNNTYKIIYIQKKIVNIFIYLI